MSSRSISSCKDAINSRKRKVNNYFDANPSASKERKIHSDQPQRKVFSNEKDQQRFVQIFQSLTETELIAVQSVPSDVIREIAKHTVGTVRDCGNRYCDNKMVVLQQDKSEISKGFSHRVHDYGSYGCTVLDHALVYECAVCKGALNAIEYVVEWGCGYLSQVIDQYSGTTGNGHDSCTVDKMLQI